MKTVTLKMAYDLFIFDRETYCSKTSIRNYQINLSYLLRDLETQFGCTADEIDILTITPNHIRTYIHNLRQKTIPQKGNRQLASRTVKTYSVDVRTFFKFLYNNEYLEQDIMKNIKIIKEEEKIKQPLYADEVKSIDAIFNMNSKTGVRNACLFHCMLDAGMRSGEVVRLKIKDVDFQHNLINIIKSKGSKGRLVPLAPNLKKLLYKYLTLYRPDSLYDNFFLNSGDEPLPFTAHAMHGIFGRLKKRTGIERLNPHLCRHTFATAYMLQGGDLETLRIYLGHTSYETTRMYLHLSVVFNNLGVDDVYKLHPSFFKRRSDNA